MGGQPRNIMETKITNVVIAGLGGQGVLKCSDILADAAFREGWDVKKAEVHGMSQRGGSVSSDVRFGRQVFSPMVSPGQADYLVVLEETQIEPTRHWLRPGGVLINAASMDVSALPSAKALNVAALGMLSVHLTIGEASWLSALGAAFPEKLHEANEKAFRAGQAAKKRTAAGGGDPGSL